MKNILIDLHNDAAMKIVANGSTLHRSDDPFLQITMSAIAQVRPAALIFAAYSDPYFRGADAMQVVGAQFDALIKEFNAPGSELELALRARDLDGIHGRNRSAAYLAVEGGYAIEEDPRTLSRLDELYSRGMRLMTLTHAKSTGWAGSDHDRAEMGLNATGEKVVRRLNDLGVVVDVAHASTQTIIAAAKISRSPIVYSHGGVRGLVGGTRAIEDSAIRAISDRGGLIAMSVFPQHLTRDEGAAGDWMKEIADEAGKIAADRSTSPTEKFGKLARLFQTGGTIPENIPGVEVLFDNIDYVVRLVGEDFAALGSDYDGIPYACSGIESFARIGALFDCMRRRGYSGSRIAKLSGFNARRVLETILK